jgi:hypothetical protein
VSDVVFAVVVLACGVGMALGIAQLIQRRERAATRRRLDRLVRALRSHWPPEDL